ncbi:hypothetical protein CBU02nite_06130 [Clostridium butyricum]|uniref:Uncharacterized protein n=1 Tax=Clostridium butyricum TaxID=1492 RepID=A0A512TIQ2_CLOBU|nr:hypothetical protein [Clostridium butyricum]NOW23165.1 hypothetical protein [Clostridium butyricum]GEQ20107.1 hypothetical protein CBU02nite_06130 [Clostridium butyricum]
MEFILNKIDRHIREKMQEETKDHKVHSGKGINVNKDLKDEKDQFINEKEDAPKEQSDKRYITIDGVKYRGKNINIEVEKLEEINESNGKGRILDRKK